MAEVNKTPLVFTVDNSSNLVQVYDGNGDGKVTSHERAMRLIERDQHLIQDRNGDGVISVAEKIMSSETVQNLRNKLNAPDPHDEGSRYNVPHLERHIEELKQTLKAPEVDVTREVVAQERQMQKDISQWIARNNTDEVNQPVAQYTRELNYGIEVGQLPSPKTPNNAQGSNQSKGL
jgi:archaellum component FlaC